MNAKIFKSEENKILLTEDFLIFDRDKPIHYKHLLILKMTKDAKSAYCLLGQYKPGRFFTYLKSKSDQLIEELLKMGKGVLVEKEVVDSPGKWGRSGWITFSDGYELNWYTVSDGPFMYFKKDKERIGFRYLYRHFFQMTFNYVSDNRKIVEDWRKDPDIVIFNPFEPATLEPLSLSIDEFNHKNPDYSVKLNERFGPKPANQFFVGCVTFIVIIFIIIILGFILS